MGASHASVDMRERVFFALWPDPEIRARLAALAKAAHAVAGGRATAAENLHLTLAFVGDVDARARDRLIAAGDHVKPLISSAGLLRIEHLDWWRHNRIVWCGGTADADWWRLARELRGRLTDDGHLQEAKHFTPHVTLLRKARRPPRLPQPTPLPWPAVDLRLVVSEPQSAGVLYRTIASWRADQ